MSDNSHLAAAIAGHRFALHRLRSTTLAAKSFAHGAFFDLIEAKSGAGESRSGDVEPQCGVIGLFFLDVDARTVAADHFLWDIQAKSVAKKAPFGDVEAKNFASRERGCHVHEENFAYEA